MHLPDAEKLLSDELPQMSRLIAETSYWVHPSVFHALPVWYPEYARGSPAFDVRFQKQRMVSGRLSHEANILAGRALKAALGLDRKYPGYTVCHIWGYDDPKFATRGDIVRDRRFYSCVGNMILLPAPLKGLTDHIPEIRLMLKACARNLYGWVCDHEQASRGEAERIEAGDLPSCYPSTWPRSQRDNKMPNVGDKLNLAIEKRIEKRKWEISAHLNSSGPLYPSNEVREVLSYWKITV